MKIERALKELKTHQEWRTGADIEATNPYILSDALNTAIEFIQEALASESDGK